MGPSYNSIFECTKCNNKGHVSVKKKYACYDYEVDVAVPCECDLIRKNLIRLDKSGLKESITNLTFKNFKTYSPFQAAMFNLAKRFIEQNKTPFFFVGGQVGSGKTHICTAICGHFIKERSKGVIYTTAFDLLAQLKANVNDDIAYYKVMDEHTKIDVLYIDDLFKSKPTEADINHMFNLINKRYSARKITIFSSEKSISELIKIDEGLGSRIKQVSGEYCLEIETDTSKNYRLSERSNN